MALTKILTEGIKDGEIVNVDIAADAQIAKSKLQSLNLLNSDVSGSAAIARTKLANVDLVDDTSPQLGGTLDLNGFQISAGDSNGSTTNILLLGASQDLKIYHNGSGSFISDTGTGSLAISGSTVNINNSDNSEFQIKCVENAQVELYYDGSKRFETTSFGATATGTLQATGNIEVFDNGKFIAGTGSDLQIYHDGNHSYITRPNGSDGQLLIRANHSDNGIVMSNNGAVEIYYDGSIRLNTKSSGIEVTGSVDLPDNGKLLIGDGDDLQIDHSGTNSQIYHNGTGHLYIATLGTSEDIHHQSTGKMTFTTGGSERLRITDDGIKFNGDTSADNALNDYEEGTFTPEFAMTSGGHNLSYSNRQGSYTKIGNTVFVEIYIRLSGISANGSGQLTITGLPFTKSSRYGGLNISYIASMNNTEITYALVDVNATVIYIYKWNGSTVVGTTVAGAFTTTSQIMLNGTYHTS